MSLKIRTPGRCTALEGQSTLTWHGTMSVFRRPFQSYPCTAAPETTGSSLNCVREWGEWGEWGGWVNLVGGRGPVTVLLFIPQIGCWAGKPLLQIVFVTEITGSTELRRMRRGPRAWTVSTRSPAIWRGGGQRKGWPSIQCRTRHSLDVEGSSVSDSDGYVDARSHKPLKESQDSGHGDTHEYGKPKYRHRESACMQTQSHCKQT